MKSTFSRFAMLSVALVVLATALPSKACIFSDQMNSTSSGITGSGSDGSSINFNAPNSFKAAGLGLAALGLFAGGLFLKQLSQRTVDAPQSDLSDVSDRLQAEPPAAPKAASVFPIEVPAAALTERSEEIAAGIQ